MNRKMENEDDSLTLGESESQRYESLGQLAGGIAHDFNNLLAGIIGHTEISLMRLPEDTPVRKNLNCIISAAETAQRLCAQILAYSGQGKYKVEQLNICKIIDNICNLLEVSIPKNVRVNLEHTQDLCINGDKVLMDQLFINLVKNAADAIGSDKMGSINVQTGLNRKNKVYIRITDNGCGIPEENLNRVFEPYFSTKEQGHGLGLAAVKGIIKSHNGDIRVNSNIGIGTTFYVEFPPSEGEARESIVEEKKRLNKNLGVLVIDDEEVVRTYLEVALECRKHKVFKSDNGLDGIRLYLENKDDIDLVLLDICMPGLNGFRTLRQLKAINRYIKVILISGYNKSSDIKDYESKNVRFLQKPFKLEKLDDEMRSLFTEPDE